jgi:hypothetical protein
LRSSFKTGFNALARSIAAAVELNVRGVRTPTAAPVRDATPVRKCAAGTMAHQSPAPRRPGNDCDIAERL